MKTYLIALVTIFFLNACSGGDFTKNELINALSENGIQGTESEKFYQMLGAIDGFGLEGDGFLVEIYEFDNNNALESCGLCTYKNENFGLYIYESYTTLANEEIIIETFEGL